jgi:putative oxygen-independent coproporphyrinogen III oxidase
LYKFGLYIHWPFCLKKCPYCDFNSYAFSYNNQDWVDALIQEIEQYALIFPNYQLATIFFGGGTPSLIPPKDIRRILACIKSIWPFEKIETTLETNPSSLETHNLEEFMYAGINRFSIGMQSLKDDNLKFLGRLHSAQEAVKILTHASKLNVRVSGDFIYALPYDTLPTWKKDLDQIVDLAFKLDLKHLSMYQLVIEPNTGFEQAVRAKKWAPMSDDLQTVLYRHTHNVLSKINWHAYEISNYAKNEQNYCKHNMIYWNYESYLGVGPGAHSRMQVGEAQGRLKFNNCKNPYTWLENIRKNQNCTQLSQLSQVEDLEELSEKDQFVEKLLMGFRLTNGIKIGSEDWKFIEPENFDLLMKKDLIRVRDQNHYLSLSARLRLNSILDMIIK